MAEIPDIQIRNVHLNSVPDYLIYPPHNIPVAVPVTVKIGVPIIDMPGCVEAHDGNRNSRTLVDNDPKGSKVFCDGHVPSYRPMDYVPEQLVYTKEADVPPVQSPPDAGEVEAPKTDIPDVPKEELPCPGPNAPRIGDIAQNKKEKVIGFELNEEKTICITLYEDIGIVEQYLPAPQVVTTTAAIATVATTSALLAKPLADLLLKVVKPAVKKAIGAIQTKLGRKPRRLTPSEVKSNLYREKRGLLPLKELKRKKN